MENTIKVKMNSYTKDLIWQISNIKQISQSSILRNVLKEYKSIDRSPLIKNEDDYSITVHVTEKDNFTIRDYKLYAENISNDEIYLILDKLYNVSKIL